MDLLDGHNLKIDEMHARITEARVAIRRAIACNSRTPCLAGSQDAFTKLTETDRLLRDIAACLPWRSTITHS